MIRIECPACGHTVRGPASFVGKKIKCKKDDCKSVFVVAEALPEVPDPIVHEAPVIEERSNPVLAGPAIDPATKQESKYPNLLRYVQWSKSAAFVQLILLLLVAVFFLIAAIAQPVISEGPLTSALGLMFVQGVVSALIALASYIVYVASMAAIELIYVLLDIEANTRSEVQQ